MSASDNKPFIQKNNTTRVYVSASEYRGERRLDVREYYYDPALAKWSPSTKGTSLTIAQGRELLKALEQVLANAAKPLPQPSVRTDLADEDEDEDEDSGVIHGPCRVAFLYKDPTGREVRYQLDLVGCLLSQNTRTAISLHSSEGKQFIGRKVGEIFNGAVLGSAIGKIRLLQIS